MIYDETQNEFYLPRIKEGVSKVGGVALSFSELGYALDELGPNVNNVVATGAPEVKQSERLTILKAIPLVDKTHELEIPIALIGQHPAIKKLARLEEQDTVINSNSANWRGLSDLVALWLSDPEAELRTARGTRYHRPLPVIEELDVNSVGYTLFEAIGNFVEVLGR